MLFFFPNHGQVRDITAKPATIEEQKSAEATAVSGAADAKDVIFTIDGVVVVQVSQSFRTTHLSSSASSFNQKRGEI